MLASVEYKATMADQYAGKNISLKAPKLKLTPQRQVARFPLLAVMLQQSQIKQGQKLSFFTTNQRISAIKAQAFPNHWGVEPPNPPCLRPCWDEFPAIQIFKTLFCLFPK